ncbi:Predicted nucleotidyltransferase component of viral defense system [Reichenbachiella agariperforans]|uniref:Predicted nucleotidyltransferase component of viral defense system n=1 Tax=Reichenbachiella agariperforans TaxID=156994 RepID=A0A1M6T5B1_REIAG|nr:nucleotidyl transferase AbiEii/AbiGii toxin family protein [Reichenbachiella agariperforans]SHK52147.1 Predicted nucleotidyltransferase component of viral defense system [Reichenbachiella agariperforans]
MNNWLTLSKEEQVELFTQVGVRMNLPSQAIEKDAWVTLMLRMIFNSELARQFIFKGGTSLSKAFNLIQRFSEDIDLGLDRSYLGFKGELTKGEIRKLRRACHTFVSEKLTTILTHELNNYGIEESLYDIAVDNEKISDQDPEMIQVNYNSVFEEVSYLPKRVLIEVSARSLREPFQEVKINSFIDQQYSEMDFSEPEFQVQATSPQKTFLEKLILLHEEFEKPADKIRHLRMSRHFYDIGQIVDSEFGDDALNNSELFNSIIEHRKVFTPSKTTDYETLDLKTLNITPPQQQLKNYSKDYRDMQGSMIHGSSESFDVLLEKLNRRLKQY